MTLTHNELQQYGTEMLAAVITVCNQHEVQYFLAYGSALGAVRHHGPIPWDTDVDIVIPYDQFDTFIQAIKKDLPDKFYLDYYETNDRYPVLFPRIGLKGYSTSRLHIDVYKLIGAPDHSEKWAPFLKKTDFYRVLYHYKKPNNEYFGFHKIPLKAKLIIYFELALMFFIPAKVVIRRFDKHCRLYPYRKATVVMNSFINYNLKEFMPRSFFGEGVIMDYDGLKVRVPEKYDDYLKHLYGDYMTFPPESEREVAEQHEIKAL